MVQIYGPDHINNVMQQVDEMMDLDPFELYVNAIRSEETREKYHRRLRVFFDFIQLPDVSFDDRCRLFVNSSKENPKYTLMNTFKFVLFQKSRLEKKEIVVSTIYNYLKPIKLLCKINDLQVNWQKVTMGLPKERKYAQDRAPTLEEIQKLCLYPDRRIRIIVSLMISSGIRLGAWNDIKFKHVKPIERSGKVIAAKLTVYAGSEEQYQTYVTPECYHAMKEWEHFRKTSGEEVTSESWLLRNLWDVTTPSGGPKGLATMPKKLKHTGVKSLVERALRAQGIRTHLKQGEKRFAFPTDHGFRKFFKSTCEMSGMKSLNIEMLLNHSCGVTDSYYRPLENDLLDDYLKAVKNLTIFENYSEELKEEIENLNHRNMINEHHIAYLRLEKDDAYTTLSDQVLKLSEEVEKLRSLAGVKKQA
jgi:integrase